MFDMPASQSQLPCSRGTGPRPLQTPNMTHIANCMRPAAPDASSPVYITMETSFLSPVSAPRNTSSPPMNHFAPRRSKSLRNLQAESEESIESISPLEKSPSATTSKYQFWPSASFKSPLGQSRPAFSSDRLSALSMGRSSTSLSDTVVTQETVPFWQRSGSLARRRKVSVPELGSTMTTVQEMPLDSRKSNLTFQMMSLLTVPSDNTRETTPSQSICRGLRPRTIQQCPRHKLEKRSLR